MQFKEIIGQHAVKKRLIQTVRENRIPHAQLFTGNEGCGKLALAIAYAQYVCCLQPADDDACGKCSSCNKYQKLIHPDLHFVFPTAITKDVKTKPISDKFLKSWRETIIKNPYLNLNGWYEAIGIENKQGIINKEESYEIIRKLNFKSYESDYKVMVIWLPEKMNASAANKLLKMIEEPPQKTLFLLVSDFPDQIINTIRSRTQIVHVPPIDNEAMQKALAQRFELPDNELQLAAKLSSGNYLKALNSLKMTEESEFLFELFTRLMRLCYSRKIIEIIQWVDEVARIGRERQKRFFQYGLHLVRENFMLNIAQKHKDELVFITNKEAGFSSKFYPFINETNVYQMQDELNKAHQHIERNANNKVVLLDMALKITKLIKPQK